VILFALGGYAVSRVFGVESALPAAVVLGLVVGSLVPARAGCTIRAPVTDDPDG